MSPILGHSQLDNPFLRLGARTSLEVGPPSSRISQLTTSTPLGVVTERLALGRLGTRHSASRNYSFGVTRYWVRRLFAEPGPAHIQEFRLYLPGVDGGTKWVLLLLQVHPRDGFTYAAATPPLRILHPKGETKPD